MGDGLEVEIGSNVLRIGRGDGVFAFVHAIKPDPAEEIDCVEDGSYHQKTREWDGL